MAKKMWSFKTKNFTVIWEIERDVLWTQFMEKETADECRKKVKSGEWKCFMSTVKVIDNATGVGLGEACLGNSIYENPADFRDHFGMRQKGYGSYFSEMVREAIAEARKTFAKHQARIRKEIAVDQKILAAKQNFLAARLRSQRVVLPRIVPA